MQTDEAQINLVGDASEAARPRSIDNGPRHNASAVADSPVRVHLGFIDGLRGVAALYVVLHHCMLQVWPPDYNVAAVGYWKPFSEVFRWGHSAVALFIVISGFCLMLPVVRNGWTIKGGAVTFYGRRVRRILPPYYAAMLLSLALIALFIGRKTGTHWDCSLPVTVSSITTHALLLHDIFQAPGGSINHVFWSIAVEVHIYILFPLMMWTWRRVSPWITVAVTILLSSLLANVLQNTSFNGMNVQLLGLFVLGMLAAAICYGEEAVWVTLRRLPWATLTPGFLIVYWLTLRHWGDATKTDIFMGLFGASTLVWAAGKPASWIARALSWKPLAFVGLISYSLYLTHAPFIQMIWQYGIVPLKLDKGPSYLLLSVAGTPVLVGLAYLFFVRFEKPFTTMVAKT